MTAPVFLASTDTLTPSDALARAQPGDRLVLTGTEAHHAVSVRRVRPGERVDLVDGTGTRLVCEVTDAGAGRGRGPAGQELGVRLVERLRDPLPPLRLVLVQALAKGGRDEQAVETATEVGVEQVVPWQAGRSVAVWKGTKATKGRERWQATAREAAKQSRRATVPEVAEPVSTAGLAAWVREVTAQGGCVLLAHEEALRPLTRADLPVAPTPQQAPEASAGPEREPGVRPVVAVVVGPEGGIGAEEVRALRDAGARMVRLGPHVMRTASAGPVALAVIAHTCGLWE